MARPVVARGAAVAEADVEHAVGTERRCRRCGSAAAGRRRAARGAVDRSAVPSAAHRVLVDAGVAVAVRVVDVQLRAVGREREPEQALLAAGARSCRARSSTGVGSSVAVADRAARGPAAR